VTIEQNWSEEFTVGVEEELMILDAETFEQRPEVDEIVAGVGAVDGEVKQELFASVVELTSGVCETPAQAIEKLRALRGAASHAADEHGLVLAGAGSHPLSDPTTQAIASNPRYSEFVAYAGISAKRQGVSGLHVHVGMPDADACLRTLERVLPWLPVVLALSANSPYFDGRESGMMSIRAEILGILPRRLRAEPLGRGALRPPGDAAPSRTRRLRRPAGALRRARRADRRRPRIRSRNV